MRGEAKLICMLHDEFRHAAASTPPDCRVRQSVSVPAPSLRPRLATTHSVLFAADSDFFFSVWWWWARSGFFKGETDGILVRTRFCQNYFLGKWFAKTSNESFKQPIFCFLPAPDKIYPIILQRIVQKFLFLFALRHAHPYYY